MARAYLATKPKSPAHKLGLQPGGRLRAMGAPPGLAALLGALPERAVITEHGDSPAALILLFARNSTELVRQLPRAMAAMEPSGALWVAYYKGTAGIATDINRDIIREHAGTLGLCPTTILAIDPRWSALRLKPV